MAHQSPTPGGSCLCCAASAYNDELGGHEIARAHQSHNPGGICSSPCCQHIMLHWVPVHCYGTPNNNLLWQVSSQVCQYTQCCAGIACVAIARQSPTNGDLFSLPRCQSTRLCWWPLRGCVTKNPNALVAFPEPCEQQTHGCAGGRAVH